MKIFIIAICMLICTACTSETVNRRVYDFFEISDSYDDQILSGEHDAEIVKLVRRTTDGGYAVKGGQVYHDLGTAFSRIRVVHKFRHEDGLYAVLACERNNRIENWLLVFDKAGKVVLHDLQSGKLTPFQTRGEPGGTVILFQEKSEKVFSVWHIYSADRIVRIE